MRRCPQPIRGKLPLLARRFKYRLLTDPHNFSDRRPVHIAGLKPSAARYTFSCIFPHPLPSLFIMWFQQPIQSYYIDLYLGEVHKRTPRQARVSTKLTNFNYCISWSNLISFNHWASKIWHSQGFISLYIVSMFIWVQVVFVLSCPLCIGFISYAEFSIRLICLQ